MSIKYFESQVFNTEEEISYSEALKRSWYVACQYANNKKLSINLRLK